MFHISEVKPHTMRKRFTDEFISNFVLFILRIKHKFCYKIYIRTNGAFNNNITNHNTEIVQITL